MMSMSTVSKRDRCSFSFGGHRLSSRTLPWGLQPICRKATPLWGNRGLSQGLKPAGIRRQRGAVPGEITASKTVIDSLRTAFPRDVRPEDLIMLAIGLENDVGITVNTATFAKEVTVLEFNTVVEAGDGSYKTAPVTAWSKDMSVSCTLTYPQLKEAVRYLYSLAQSTTLEGYR